MTKPRLSTEDNEAIRAAIGRIGDAYDAALRAGDTEALRVALSSVWAATNKAIQLNREVAERATERAIQQSQTEKEPVNDCLV